MKILIYSPSFYPNIGGLESIITTLAFEFLSQGQEVKLISLTPDRNGNSNFPFEVIRQPAPNEILKLMRWSDVFFQGCVSLKGLWPLSIVPRPLVISHQTWYCRSDGKANWQDYIKKLITYLGKNISASHAIAESIPAQSVIIPNSYQDDVFFEIPDIPRDQELVFLGRLVSDKGADLLLSSLAQLKEYGLQPRLTIIGNGPEERNLRQQAHDLELTSQITFAGIKQGTELAKLLNAHQIMVIPSRWKEPFGIVALEGIACGCIAIGSEGGGLKDAIGPCGITFPNGDVVALSKVLALLLSEPQNIAKYRLNAKEHLSQHHKAVIAKKYLQVFKQAIDQWK
uniref:Glycosyl transferase group 1 n=1 Tax=Cyanothece sp. (strain PCC 7425 / ATCC 29141) TaxID=395961 RepID=B8HNC7_CYAP4